QKIPILKYTKVRYCAAREVEISPNFKFLRGGMAPLKNSISLAGNPGAKTTESLGSRAFFLGNWSASDFKVNGLFGSFGTEPGQFNHPRSVSLDGNGHLLVLDSSNARVQRLDVQGNFLGSFGRYGSVNGQFASPTALVAGAGGRIYVADSGNACICSYNREG